MSKSEDKPAVHYAIWPAVLIGFGLSLTAVWIGLLAYGLVKLIEHAV